MEPMNNNTNLAAIPMTAINNSIVQIPTRENDKTAVAACEIKGPYGSVSDFGVANPASTGTEDHAVLIQAARDSAIQRAAGLAGCLHQASHQAVPTTIDAAPQESVFGPAPARKALPNGGGNRPMSSKQSNFIQQLCQQKGVSPEDICKKPLENMTGSDANDVIKKLTAK